MTVADQLDRLLDLGLAELTGASAASLRATARGLPELRGGTLAIHPSLAPARTLAPLLRNVDGSGAADKPGFVVTDLTDLEAFEPIEPVTVPAAPLYVLTEVDRGDDLRGWSSNEALPELLDRGRTPLTVNEGISWLLQEPARLQRNHCFMTIGSRRRTARGLDARTPAIWISGGTGRDGAERKGAPKIGWCWAGNRHDWLGYASAGSRVS